MKERFPQPGLLGCVALFIQTVSPSRPITQKKHMKITQRCDESSCQILKMVFSITWPSISVVIPLTEKANATPRAVRRYVTMTFAHPCDKSFRRKLASSYDWLLTLCLMAAEEFRPGNELTLFCKGCSLHRGLRHPFPTETLEESTGERGF